MGPRGPHRIGVLFIAGLFTFTLGLGAVHAQPRRAMSPTAHKEVTCASWYGDAFKGLRTASGSIFDPQHLTAAHPTLGLGSEARVTELRSGRSVVVRITDRGPYLRDRGIDLSYAAARALGIVRRGVAQVRVEPVTTKPPSVGPPIVTASSGPTPSWLPKAIVQ